jgi:hypothetical protein
MAWDDGAAAAPGGGAPAPRRRRASRIKTLLRACYRPGGALGEQAGGKAAAGGAAAGGFGPSKELLSFVADGHGEAVGRLALR